MNSGSKKKKVIIITLIIIIIVLALLALLAFFLPKFLSIFDEEESEKKYYYYPENYDEDIFLNPHYEGLEKSVRFGDANLKVDYTIDTVNSAPEDGQLFIRYFDDAINGRYEDFGQYFVDGFFISKPKFTMQMIYDISVEKMTEITKENVEGEETDVFNYYVSYKIYRNNGTFRTKVSSDTAVPQIYQVYRTKDNTFKIYRILDIVYK